ncbi:hypothetical protein [Leuconostoc falkenbergense]|uniref:hypothetical protein n=1 Tax=Leuconostoc falkenbergense TaxID=2766470 RepID=UPI00166B6AB6|nr:hypothetical protein [Leuconostoc falkenbergense]
MNNNEVDNNYLKQHANFWNDKAEKTFERIILPRMKSRKLATKEAVESVKYTYNENLYHIYWGSIGYKESELKKSLNDYYGDSLSNKNADILINEVLEIKDDLNIIE